MGQGSSGAIVALAPFSRRSCSVLSATPQSSSVTPQSSSRPTPLPVRSRSLFAFGKPRSLLKWLRPFIWSFAYRLHSRGLACSLVQLPSPPAPPCRSLCLSAPLARKPIQPSGGRLLVQSLRGEQGSLPRPFSVAGLYRLVSLNIFLFSLSAVSPCQLIC